MRDNLPGCLILAVVVPVALFFIVSDFAKAFVWLKWAVQ